jgi:xanthine dehydrogenase accessory factor
MIEDRAVFQAALESAQQGRPAALATIIQVEGSVPRHVGSKMLIWETGEIVGTVGGGAMEARIVKDAQAAIREGSARTVSYTLNDLRDGDPGICGGTVTVFVEPLYTPPVLLVIGCGHVGKALAELGKWSGFRVIVSDDRADYCNPTVIPNMDRYLVCPPSELVSAVTITPQTYITAVTRGLPVDEKLLPALIQTPAAYIGLIGSRRRWALTVKALSESGIDPTALARIHAPIGLELNAETPQEIAVSIMAEIIMIQRGGDGRPMRMTASNSTSV